MRTANLLAAALCALALGAPLVSAGAAAPEGPCADGAERVGDLGLRGIECDCTYGSRTRSRDGRARIARSWVFRSEPRVVGIAPDGPAAGRLREGDVITAVDGALITTRAGGNRFAGVTPGVPVTLGVRRDGRDMTVRIVPGSVCPEAALGTFPRAPFDGANRHEPPPPPWMGTTPAPAPPMRPQEPAGGEPRVGMFRFTPQAFERGVEETLPRGWTGFGLRCSQCGSQAGPPGQPPVWDFRSLPEIYFVDPESPAARAGFEIGDVLTHIDGVSLLDEEGGRRFGSVRPGQKVVWTFRRGGTVRTAEVVTVPRPEAQVLPLEDLKERLRLLGDMKVNLQMKTDMERLSRELARLGRESARPEGTSRRLRYAGSVGGSQIEVRGLGNVVVDDSGDEIVITTRDATIRVRPTRESKAPRPAGK
jgi:hypothetical protein